jgi:hypothetical protein
LAEWEALTTQFPSLVSGRGAHGVRARAAAQPVAAQ